MRRNYVVLPISLSYRYKGNMFGYAEPTAADAKRRGAAKKHSLAPSGEGYAEKKCRGVERRLIGAHQGRDTQRNFPITWRGDGQ